MNSATIKHVSRDHVHLAPGPSYDITIFQLPGRPVEAVVSARDGTESTRLKIEPPAAGRKIEIIGNEDGSFEVLYHDA